MTILLILQFCFLEVDPFEEIFHPGILAVAQKDEAALLITSNYGSYGTAPSFYLYRDANQALKELEHHSLPNNNLLLCFVADFGYWILDFKHKVLIALDQDGGYLEKKEIITLGNTTFFRVVNAFMQKDGTLALTYRDLSSPNELHLISFDPKTLVSEPLFHIEEQEPLFSAYWVPFGEQWYFVSPEERKVVLYDRDFTKIKTTIPPLDPTVISAKFIQSHLRERAFSINGNLLHHPFTFIGKYPTIAEHEYVEKKKILKHYWQLKEKPVKIAANRLPLLTFSRNVLYYDKEDHRFWLEKKNK